MRILLVEDHAGDERLIREVLRADASVELETARTLREGIETCTRCHFDAVLLDLALPDSRGLETVLRLQKAAPRVAVVVLTGRDDGELALEAAKAGAQDYLVKGRVDLDLLRRSVRYAIARKSAEAQLQESRQRLRALTARIQEAREEERTVIAREIHDELGQSLTALKMDVSWLQTRLSSCRQMDVAPLNQKTETMLPLIDGLIGSVQRISSDLRPSVLDDLGLVSAIEWYVSQFRERTDLDVELALPEDDVALDSGQATALYRVLQETLTNVVRHASATRIEVSLHIAADGLFMEVKDNGRGILPEQVRDSKSLGLLGMRERLSTFGGKLLVHGERGQGTVVTVTMPVSAKSQ